MPPGATRNSEKRIVLQIVNLQFSKFLKNGTSDLAVHLHISDLVFWSMGETSLNLSWPHPIPRKKSRDRKSKFWWPVRRFGKVHRLVWYPDFDECSWKTVAIWLSMENGFQCWWNFMENIWNFTECKLKNSFWWYVNSVEMVYDHFYKVPRHCGPLKEGCITSTVPDCKA